MSEGTGEESKDHGGRDEEKEEQEERDEGLLQRHELLKTNFIA